MDNKMKKRRVNFLALLLVSLVYLVHISLQMQCYCLLALVLFYCTHCKMHMSTSDESYGSYTVNGIWQYPFWLWHSTVISKGCIQYWQICTILCAKDLPLLFSLSLFPSLCLILYIYLYSFYLEKQVKQVTRTQYPNWGYCLPNMNNSNNKSSSVFSLIYYCLGEALNLILCLLNFE